MIKELIRLANHLDDKGLTKEADIVDNIVKSAGELEDMMAREMGYNPDEMPEPTLAPVEQPDMDHPVFNSGENKEDSCEELTGSLLALMGSGENLDVFYDAASGFVNELKRISDYEQLDYITIPARRFVKSTNNFLFTGSMYSGFDSETGDYDFSRTHNKKYEGSDKPIFSQIDSIIEYLASYSNPGLIISDFANILCKQMGIDKSCLKSALIKLFKKSGKKDSVIQMKLEDFEDKCAE